MISRFETLVASMCLAAVAAVTASSCNVNDYCLNCANGMDAGGDGNPNEPDADVAPDGYVLPDGGICTPTGNEVCDGKDNDCDTQIDEGQLPEVGDTCGENRGECTVGAKQCVNGAIKCSGVAPMPEICDNKDNDCNGTVDNGDPGGGGQCGTNLGECSAGTNRCLNGTVQCIGAIGTPGGVAETCDGRDNDCDGNFDEGLTNLGSCGMTNTGECSLGTLMCSGGVATCVGDVGPTFELCDALDQDCDGNPTNGFNLQTDARNCGVCNNVCMTANATPRCAAGNCAIGACASNFFDVDGVVTNGCEYGPCTFRGPVEVCNGADDNCNGSVDDGLTAPNICRSAGACAGVTATCTGAGGFKCTYGANVSVDGNGDIIPETECDNIDNDCDGRIDEGDTDKGAACGDNGKGVCRATGVRVCDPANKNAPTICQINTLGQMMSPEACDNLDNDCDGNTDEGANTGNLLGQQWVTLGGVQIMKYEASRPDSTATLDGSVTTAACSRPNVQPWVNIKHGQAAAACSAIGARLCTEVEWNRACSVLSGTSYPVNAPAGTAIADRVFIEAENYFSVAQATSGNVVRAWVPDASPGYSGTMGLRASPNTGANVSAANSLTRTPRLDYQINFTATGNHTIWLRMLAGADADDRLFVGINNTIAGATAGTEVTATVGSEWVWVKGPQINVTTTGNKFVSVWMGRDGIRLDAIGISRENSNTAPTFSSSNGGLWAYENNPNVASDTTCNAQPFDTNTALAGNQDDNLRTGAMASCFANGPGTNDAFDMSGNVREWVAPRLPGANPIRGGAANGTVVGSQCGLSFTLADNNFFFPNVGFRCCR